MGYWRDYAGIAQRTVQNNQDWSQQFLQSHGADPWSIRRRELQSSADDFGNYLSSGNYTTENNKKYRDQATQAVADLDNEMKRYGKSSDEYKTLDSYRNYYQNALGTFDRIDVGTTVNDYLSSKDWHDAEAYENQRASLQTSIDNIQAEMDKIEDKASADYKDLEMYRDWYQSLMDGTDDSWGLAQREAFDRTFSDVNDYINWQNADDFSRNVQIKNNRSQAEDRLKTLQAAQRLYDMQYGSYYNSEAPAPTEVTLDTGEKMQIADVNKEIADLTAQVEAYNKDLEGLEKYQYATILNNYNRGVFESGRDYGQELDDLISARGKAQTDDEREKIDMQIKYLAGENEDGTNAEGLFDESTLYGQWKLNSIDLDEKRKELANIDVELDKLGAGRFTMTEAELKANDDHIRDLKAEKRRVQQEINSAELVQKKQAMADKINSLSDEDKARMKEAALEHIENRGLGLDRWVKPGEHGPEESGFGDLDYFSYLNEDGSLMHESEIRDLILTAIGAEWLGEDLGFEAQDLIDAYYGQMAQIAGYKDAEKISNMESDFGRWNTQVLGVGTLAGLNQFASGVKQAFSDDYVAPNRVTNMAGFTREDLKRYGDPLVKGSNLSQILFDTTQTTANMLPMIAASYLTGGALGAAGVAAKVAGTASRIVGAGVMGLSSGGSSYNQALAEGWSKEDAKLFGVLMGSAEAGMQYLIGGIGALGGVTEDALLNYAKGINNAFVRGITETGIHIASETAEELAQNRLERCLTYTFSGGNKGDADWWSWNDDDWYTVVVTALSTAALEAPGSFTNSYRTKSIGNLAAGNTQLTDAQINKNQKKLGSILSSRQSKQNAQARLLANEVGRWIKTSSSLVESLEVFGADVLPADTEAHELATRMRSNKSLENNMNIGNLFQMVMSENVGEDGKVDIDRTMNQIIGGAIYWDAASVKGDALKAAKERKAAVLKANPGAQVLDATASELTSKYGAPATAETIEVASLIEKIKNGESLSTAQMKKLTSFSTEAQAARVMLSTMQTDAQGPLALSADSTAAWSEKAINDLISQARAEKEAAKAAQTAGTAAAIIGSGNKVDVVRATEGAERQATQPKVTASDVKALQEATNDVELARAQVNSILNMTAEEVGQFRASPEMLEAFGPGDAKMLIDLAKERVELQDKIDKMPSFGMPSKEKWQQLQDAKNRIAEIERQINALVNAEVEASKKLGSAKGEASTKPVIQAKAAQNSSGAATDTVAVGDMQMSRDEYISRTLNKDKNKNLTEEQRAEVVEKANAEFDNLLQQTGGVKEDINGRDQSSTSEEKRNAVDNAADRGEDRSGADQSGSPDVGRTETSRNELFAADPESGNAAVYASDGATVTDVSKDTSLEASLAKDHPGLTGMSKYLLDSGFTSVRYVTNGDILVDGIDPETGEKVGIPVAALVRGTDLVLNLDFKSPGYSFVRTAEHERTHLRLGLLKKSDAFGREETRNFISSTLQNILGRQAYADAFMKYLAEYGPAYTQNNKKIDPVALGHMINEEMFCDMVAGLNCWDAALGQYQSDIEGLLETSKFDVITDALMNDEDPYVGLMYEETEVMPYGFEMKEKLDITDPFRSDVDRTKPPEARPLPGEEAMHEEQQLMSLQSMAEATGFELVENDEGYPYALKNLKTGETVNKVSPHMMVDTPIGRLVTTANKNGFISNYAANREYVMLSQVMNLILENKDAALTWELVGSQMFSGIKKNSDTQYNWTIDFGTICRKTQALVTAMSETMKKVGHGLSRREIEAVYLETGLAGEATPCPVCYVFSRWMGIGGLLDDINTFQNMYFNADGSWADGRSEASLAAFMSEVETSVKDWAKEKQKKDFFKEANAENKFAQDNLNFGKILSDMKSSPNRILADATKKINDSRQAKLIIQELERAVKNATPEHATKINNAIEKMRGYILSDDQIKAQEARIAQAEAELTRFDRYQWAARAVMQRSATDTFENGERVYEWKRRDDYKPVPQDILFDLDKGEEFAKNYASTWAFRTGKGNAMGKAIMPYSDARIGETIQGVATKNTKVLNEEMIEKMGVSPEDKKAVAAAMKAVSAGIKSGPTLNPFVKSTSLEKALFDAKASGDKKAIKAAEKAVSANQKEQDDLVNRAINAMRKQNLIGGMRFQSTSDFRFEWGSDYLTTFFELQAIGANVQLYTKVIEAVDFLASTGSDCNLSVMPLGLGYSVDPETGEVKLDFSNVTGINAEEAIKKAKQFDNVQLILVGINDENIRLALASTDVTFTIPFHGSGQSVDQVQTLVNLLGEDLDVELAQDYSDVQDDHVSKTQTDEQKAMWKLRMDIIQGKFWKNGTKKQAGHNIELKEEQRALMEKNPHLQRLYDMFYNEHPSEQFTPCMIDAEGKSLAYHCFLGKEQASKIFPYEYWDTSLNYDQADGNGENFKSYCASMGIVPRFSGINADGETVDHGNFANDKGYWQLLIDRKMYKNAYDANGNWVGYGEYRNQQKINVSNIKIGMLDENQARQTINEKAWTKSINPEKTEQIVAASEKRIEAMRQEGDIYDTKKVSKEFRADRLTAKKDMREAEQQRASMQEEDTTPVAQTYTSADTSINSNKLPAIFNKPNVEFVEGGTNIDIGGGRFDNATQFLKQKYNVENSIFDPYNRDRKNNAAIVERLQNGERFDTATCSNVLNVIDSPEARANVILEMAKAIKPDGAAYFTVYEGDARGGAAATTKGWQENRRLSSYKDEISRYFNDVQIRNGVITARDPKANLPQAAWEIEPGEAQRFSLQNGEEITVKIPDGKIQETGEPVAFVEKLLDGSKWGETRDHNHMAYKNWVGLTKDGKVYGRVKFGKPYQITRESPEYEHTFIEGTEYDIPEGGSKWFYPVEAKEVFDKPVANTPNGNYGKYTIPSKADLTERRAQVYNENTQRFSKQESDNNGRTENAAGNQPVVHRLSQFLQKNDWARSYLQGAREGSPGVRARDLWRTTERRQREITNGVADFFADYPLVNGKKLTELFDYGTPDFIDYFFDEAAKDPAGLWTWLNANLQGSPEELVDIFDKALKDTKAPKKFRPSFTPTDLDREYLTAVKKNDTVTLARMIKERAEKNGFNKEVFQHSKVEFPSFSRGELGFHLGSESQAAQFVQGSQHNLNPDLFLHLYANIENPEYLPMHTKERWDPDIGDWEQYDSNDYDSWNIKELAEQLEDLSPEIKAIADSTDTKYDTNKWGSKARKEFTDALDALGIHALEYDNDVEGKRGEQVKSSPYVVYDPERDNLTAYIIWDPTRLKSGDLITYETDPATGEEYIVPLSERFDPENEQFRYSMQESDPTNPFPAETLEHDLLSAIQSGDAEAASRWVNKELGKYNQKKEASKVIPPRVPTREFVPKVTPEEKAALEETRLNRIAEYGSHRASEKSNGFLLPKKNDAGKGQAKFVQNAGSSEQIPARARDQLERFAFTDEVAATYVIDSNKADISAAKNTIETRGLDYSLQKFKDLSEDMAWSYAGNDSLTKTLALGQQLLIETSRAGNMRDFLDVLSSLTLLSTQAGKSLQAFRMLKQSGPIGQLYYVQKTVDQMNNKQFAKLIESNRMKAITVDEELSKAVIMAETDEERDAAMDTLIASIAKQVPVTLMDKWNAWRHFAMLGNARTHIRNVFGNAIFVPLRFAKDLMATAGESIAVKTGLMKQEDRTKAFMVSRELRDFAKADAEVYKKELQGNGKYNPAQDILDARQIFWWKGLDKARKWNGEKLEEEDWMFLKPAYVKALGMALQNTGYTVNELQTTPEGMKALNNARRLAIEEAQRATYRDFSVAAAALNRLKRGGGAAGLLLEGVLPFTKTPINILRRGLEYSPVGIAKSFIEMAKGAKEGNLDGAQIIDHLCAGLTGTGVAIIGALLASRGWLRGKKDDKEEDFDKLQGYQDYSLQIGDLSFTIDWAAPTALPLFTGVAAYNMTQGNEKLDFTTIWDAIMLTAEPMMSLSMLDGLNRTLSAASYAGENEKIASIATSAFTSYLGQGIPTLLGQLARSIDGTRRQTYVEKDSKVPSAMQRFIQSSVQNKIPVWEEQKAPYVDQWGRTDTVQRKWLGAVENFLSPSYINMVNTTDVDEALQELYTATKDSTVLPSSPTKKYNDDRYFTAEEYTAYAKDVGSTKYALLAQLFSDARYQALTDEQKVKAIEKIYKYATAAGKYHIEPTYNLRGQGVWMLEAEAMPNELQRYNRIWEAIEAGFKD